MTNEEMFSIKRLSQSPLNLSNCSVKFRLPSVYSLAGWLWAVKVYVYPSSELYPVLSPLMWPPEYLNSSLLPILRFYTNYKTQQSNSFNSHSRHSIKHIFLYDPNMSHIVLNFERDKFWDNGWHLILWGHGVNVGIKLGRATVHHNMTQS